MKAVSVTLIAFLVAMLASCASMVGRGGPELGEQLSEQSGRHGVVTRIEAVELEGDHQLGVGTILGAVAGGILGNEIGHGGGAVIGAIGGGLAGNAIQNRYVDRRPGQHIFVRLTNGASVSVTQPAGSGLRVGDRVFIEGGGRDARVVRA